MTFGMPVAFLVALSSQSGGKASNADYKRQIEAIKSKVASSGEFKAQNMAIDQYLEQIKAKKEPLTDTEILSVTYRLVYKIYNLGYNTDSKLVSHWKIRCERLVPQLKDSLEKQICLAFFDRNDGSWMFDRYPEWRQSNILAMICYSNSVMGMTTDAQYQVFSQAYEPAITEIGTSFRKIGFDATRSLGEYFHTKDKKYLRGYIDLLREYATKALDKGSAQRAKNWADKVEEMNFKKGA